MDNAPSRNAYTYSENKKDNNKTDSCQEKIFNVFLNAPDTAIKVMATAITEEILLMDSI